MLRMIFGCFGRLSAASVPHVLNTPGTVLQSGSLDAYAMARMLGAVIDEGITAGSRTLNIHGRSRLFFCQPPHLQPPLFAINPQPRWMPQSSHELAAKRTSTSTNIIRADQQDGPFAYSSQSPQWYTLATSYLIGPGSLFHSRLVVLVSLSFQLTEHHAQIANNK